MNAAETLLAAGCDEHLALQCREQRITYRVLRRLVRQSAGAWLARGLRPGERVFVVAPDSVDWVVAWLGAVWAGGVAVGLDPQVPAPELETVLGQAEPRFVWCSAEVARMVQRIKRLGATVVRNSAAWSIEVAAAPLAPAVRRDPEDPALWIVARGRSGAPHCVVHAQRSVAHAHAFACGVLGADCSDRFHAGAPLFVAWALGNSLLAGLRVGATVLLDPEGALGADLRPAVERLRPTLVFGADPVDRRVVGADAVRRLAAAGVRRYVSIGATLPAGVRQTWGEATAAAPVSGYGTAETLVPVLYADDATGLLKPAPLADIGFAAVADAAAPQRIWIRHSAVARGYWGPPEAQADSFRAGGWFSPPDHFLRYPHDRLGYAASNRVERRPAASARRVLAQA